MGSRALGIAFVCIVVAACGGAPPSAVPSSSATASASTELVLDVDVEGHSMHLICAGPSDTGRPTVLLEAGGGEDSLAWAEVMPSVQSTHRVCAYDRAGLGQSQPPIEPSRTAADQAADLRKLLDRAGVKGPFVIGAHSYGAMVAILFTHANGQDVVGLVFAEPESPRVSARTLDALPTRVAGEPKGIAELRDALEDFETDPSLNPEHLHLRRSNAEAAASLDLPGPLFGNRPVLILSRGTSPGAQMGLPADLAKRIDEIWFTAQQELADESTAGSRTTVANVGHDIPNEQPAAVVEALERVLAAVTTP
jgi:pimeloyl-ACP methyl ester carboxylesterase